MKDAVIGTLAGVVAVIALSFLTPKPSRPQITATDSLASRDYPDADFDPYAVPTTRPDPVRQKLEMVLDKVEFKGERLDKVLAWFADATDTNFVIDWRALADARIGNDFPIKITLHPMTARIALKAVLGQTDEAFGRASFEVSEGVVKISTVAELRPLLYTRVYDIHDIIDDPAFKSPRFASRRDAATEREAVDEIIRIIHSSIDSRSWSSSRRSDDVSGGSVSYFAGRLVIKQTVENHRDIEEIIASLRRKGLPK